MNQTLFSRLRRSPLLACFCLVPFVLAQVPRNLLAATPTADAGAQTDGSARPRFTPQLSGEQPPTSSATGATPPDGSFSVAESSGALASVDAATGAAHAGVPFRLERARGNSQPSLGLNYSSLGGQLEAGYGWGLGIPSIERKNTRGAPVYANDPETGAVVTTSTDRFTYGGSPLVPICLVGTTTCPGTPGPALGGTESFPAWAVGWNYFRLEVDSTYERFFWSPDHQTWVIQRKSGETLELGKPLDGSADVGAIDSDGPASTTPAFRWKLSRQYDAMGVSGGTASPLVPANTIRYVWQPVNGSILTYLTDIYDTPLPNSWFPVPFLSYAHHTHLLWSSDAFIAPSRSALVYRVPMDQLLTRVDVTSASFTSSSPRSLVRSYALTYVPRGTTAYFQRSLLQSVAMMGACGVSEGSDGTLPPFSCGSLPPITFGYTNPTLNTAWSTMGGPPIYANSSMIDVDGDGFPDALRAANTSGSNPVQAAATAALNDGSGSFQGATQLWTSPSSIFGLNVPNEEASALTTSNSVLGNWGFSLFTGTDLLISFTGGGSSDFSAFGSFYNWVTSQPLSLPQLTIINDCASVAASTVGSCLFADIDADGMPDMVLLGQQAGNNPQLTVTTTLSEMSVQGVPIPFLTTLPSATVNTGSFDTPPYVIGSFDNQFVDATGDLVPDLVDFGGAPSPMTFTVAPGRGDGTFGAPITSSIPGGFDTEWSDGSNNGLGSAYCYIHDVTGDAYTDLICTDSTRIIVYPGDGLLYSSTGYLLPLPPPATDWTVNGPMGTLRFSDLDGSGVDDIYSADLQDSSDSIDPAYQPTVITHLDFYGGAAFGLLSTIDNGRGALTSLSYDTTSHLSVLAKEAGSPWSLTTPQVVHVVTDVSTTVAGSAAPGAIASDTKYDYMNPVYDKHAEAFRGFQFVRKTSVDHEDATKNAVVETTYATTTSEFPNASADAPEGALQGLATLSNSYSGAPPFLSASSVPLYTSHNEWEIDLLYMGLDGRGVRRAYVSESNKWMYNPQVAISSTSVMVQDINDLSDPTGSRASMSYSPTITLAQGIALPRVGYGTAVQIQKLTTLDGEGNVTSVTDNGVVDATIPDTPIVSHFVWGTMAGLWNWRTASSSVSDPSGTYRPISYYYDPYGNLQYATTTISNTQSLGRELTPINESPIAQASGNVTLFYATYDTYGNLQTFEHGDGTHATLNVYDDVFSQLLTIQALYPWGFADETPLVYAAAYDRGVEVKTASWDASGALTTFSYDSFGRKQYVSLPDPNNVGVTTGNNDLTFAYIDPVEGPYSQVDVTQLTVSGAPKQSAIFRDGLGQRAATVSVGGQSDGAGTWFVRGEAQRDSRSLVTKAYQAFPVTGSPFGLSSPPTPPSGTPAWTYTYDGFGRMATASGFAGEAEAKYVYGALSKSSYDAADLARGGATYATMRVDGHGRPVEWDQLTANGGGTSGASADTLQTFATYQATGELLTVKRSSVNQSATYTRWMQYDSLGRMVVNAEPNTSSGFTPVPGTPGTLPSGMKAWLYAYDLSGNIVGTTDARGCGVNYTYDGLGRETTEDFVPCELSQPGYSAPNPTTGAGYEVVNFYDAPEANEPTANYNTANPGVLAGRLAVTYSRGEHTDYNYDLRGNLTNISRQMAIPGSESYDGVPANRYTPWWYQKAFVYDNANRPIGESTGADVTAVEGEVAYYLNGVPSSSWVQTTYDARDIPVLVDGSYGNLVTGEQHAMDGLFMNRTYGDRAGTTTTYGYDSERRLSTASTARGAPSTWVHAANGTYSSPTAAEYTTPALLASLTITPDPVGNPTTIADARNATEWPPSAQPVSSTSFLYNDLYEITSATRTFGTNSQQSPYTSSDPPPIGYAVPTTRATTLTYKYDWQGNLTSSTDESNATLQRTIGTGTMGTANAGPNQLRSGTSAQGSYTNTYDAAGNLKTITATGLAAPSGNTLNVTLTYDWDEAGRLRLAERLESVWVPAHQSCTGRTCVTVPIEELGSPTEIVNTYVYDGNGKRALHSSNNNVSGTTLYTLDVFSSLRISGAEFSNLTSGDYDRTAKTEAIYLVAGGASYGRIESDATLPSVTGSAQHVFLEISDAQGSTSTVIDRDSSELVEQLTYLPFGQVDTDYRPTRWNGFREGYRYTGKEDDYEVGLTYFGARYYSELLSRWASADPLTIHGLGSDMNPYRFVHNSPMSSVDLNGLDDDAPSSASQEPPPPDLTPPTNSPQGGGKEDPYALQPTCQDLSGEHTCTNIDNPQNSQLKDAMKGSFDPNATPAPVSGGIAEVMGKGPLTTSPADEAEDGPSLGGRVLQGVENGVDFLLAAGAVAGILGGIADGGFGGGLVLAGAGGLLLAESPVLILGVAVVGVAVIAMAVAHSGRGGGSSTAGGSSSGSSQKDRATNPSKSESSVWQSAEPYKGGLRRSGNEIWDWDNLHNDIEVYNVRGQHLGSRNPTTGEMYKPAVSGRWIKL